MFVAISGPSLAVLAASFLIGWVGPSRFAHERLFTWHVFFKRTRDGTSYGVSKP